MDSTQSKSHTILFADIADSTELYERLGDSTARSLVAMSIEIMNMVVRANAGQVVKTIGDGVMGSFPFPDAAADAAVRLHEAVAADKRLMTNHLRLRIGFHHGPVIEELNDLYGDAVNLAARMAAQAKAGQIITSRQTFQMLTTRFCTTARMVDQARVKGKSDLIDIFEITWGHPEELTIAKQLNSDMVNPVVRQSASMALGLKDQHVHIDAQHPIVSLGRDHSNAIVINTPEVSRLHARIEFRKKKFVLVDQSTNGTFIYPQGDKMYYLRRDETILEGKGFLSLGLAIEPETPTAIHYLSF